MNKLRLSIGLCLFIGVVGVTAQKTERISVHAVSHNIQEHNYKTLQPQTENASCGVYKGTVYCSDSMMHAHYDANAWWLFEHLKLLFAAIGGMLIFVQRFLEFLGAAAIVVPGVPVVVYLGAWLVHRREQAAAPAPRKSRAPAGETAALEVVVMVHSAAAPAKFRRGDIPVPSGNKENRCIP